MMIPPQYIFAFYLKVYSSERKVIFVGLIIIMLYTEYNILSFFSPVQEAFRELLPCVIQHNQILQSHSTNIPRRPRYHRSRTSTMIISVEHLPSVDISSGPITPSWDDSSSGPITPSWDDSSSGPITPSYSDLPLASSSQVEIPPLAPSSQVMMIPPSPSPQVTTISPLLAPSYDDFASSGPKLQ